MDITEIFDPEKVARFDPAFDCYYNGEPYVRMDEEMQGDYVEYTAYRQLLELYRAIKPQQMTLAEVYGEIEIK